MKDQREALEYGRWDEGQQRTLGKPTSQLMEALVREAVRQIREEAAPQTGPEETKEPKPENAKQEDSKPQEPKPEE